MTEINFVKMHGLGNDFVVLDARKQPHVLSLTTADIRGLADRKTGIGCDQLIVIETAPSQDTDAFMRIRNADGGEVATCGNAARCIADLLMTEHDRDYTSFATAAGILEAERNENGLISVDMGPVRLDWRDIPLQQATDTKQITLSVGPLNNPVAVNVGNPHAVFFVTDAEAVDLQKWGPLLEHHPLFPERANIEVVHMTADHRLRMRVWERGVGITRACGSGACAALVAAARRGLTGRRGEVVLDGGSLLIDWQPDNHIVMTGPATLSFRGRLAAGAGAR